MVPFVTSPYIIADLYGNDRLGSIYSIVGIACLLGNVLFATLIPSTIYQSHIPSGAGNICYGKQCFLTTYYIIAICSAVVLLNSMILYRRSKHKLSFVGDK